MLLFALVAVLMLYRAVRIVTFPTATLFAVSLATGPVECHIRSLERSWALVRDPVLSQSDPLFLLGPRIRQRLSEAGDGEIRWRGAINVESRRQRPQSRCAARLVTVRRWLEEDTGA